MTSERWNRTGADFEFHTHTHCNMAVESDADQRRGLLLSKELLRQQVLVGQFIFAYPYGKQQQMSAAAARTSFAPDILARFCGIWAGDQ